jgi:hypothetical protein
VEVGGSRFLASTLKMEAIRSSYIFLNFNQVTRRHIPEERYYSFNYSQVLV